jgi:ligand-binding SRPBCC domain-containing protein
VVFEQRFRVKAAVENVAEFHSRPASMAAITPSPVIVRVHSAPNRLASGEQMAFTLWAGPVPIRWTARIEDMTAHGFTDRQLSGPFGSWVHRHGFERVDDHTTDVMDRVEATYKQHPFWGLVGRLMWAGMPLLFSFRARRTRAILESYDG